MHVYDFRVKFCQIQNIIMFYNINMLVFFGVRTFFFNMFGMLYK